MCKGYIKIPRRIYEERLWNIKRVYSELDAFCDIYASAYTREYKYPDGTKIKRNQFPCSLRSLADKWIWNQMKVKRFLQALERKGYIAILSDKSKTVITILDFGTDDTSVTQGVTPPVTPLLHQNPSKQGTSEVVSVTQPVTPPVTQGVTYIKNKEYNNNISSSKKEDATEARKVFDFYNQSVVNTKLPKCIKLTEKRKKSIEARIKDFGIEKVYEAITKVTTSNFCNGGGNRGWKADIDFIINPNSFVKILEGKYDGIPAQEMPIGFNLNNEPDKYKEEGW